jgi:hypothetical protein
MKIGRKPRKQESAPSEDSANDQTGEQQQPEMSGKDIVAVIIAMFQLVLPLVAGLILVGAIVAILLR